MLLIFAPKAFASDPAKPRQARVKDISSIEGIRDNQLVGYGIVVGLQGTGDSQQTTFPIQTLAATLLHHPSHALVLNLISRFLLRAMRGVLKAACF